MEQTPHIPQRLFGDFTGQLSPAYAREDFIALLGESFYPEKMTLLHDGRNKQYNTKRMLLEHERKRGHTHRRRANGGGIAFVCVRSSPTTPPHPVQHTDTETETGERHRERQTHPSTPPGR